MGENKFLSANYMSFDMTGRKLTRQWTGHSCS